MIALIQRVKKASVSILGQKQSIKAGFLIFLGVGSSDHPSDARLLAEKTIKLRIMPDKNQKMNLSLLDSKGEALVVSQFTLLGDSTKGNRPSFVKAANPNLAEKLYHQYISHLQEANVNTKTGFFGEYMEISLLNDGPTTIILDTEKLKK